MSAPAAFVDAAAGPPKIREVWLNADGGTGLVGGAAATLFSLGGGFAAACTSSTVAGLHQSSGLAANTRPERSDPVPPGLGPRIEQIE